MSRSVNAGPYAGQTTGLILRFGAMGAIVVAVGLGGCSADLGRFDLASTSQPGDSARRAPLPTESVRRGAGLGGREDVYAAPRETAEPAREPPIRMAGLPDPAQAGDMPRASVRSTPPPSQRPAAAIGRQVPTAAGPSPVATPPSQPVAAATPVGATVPPVGAAGGEVIEVQQGDTLYGIAKRHRVSISELMTLNNLDKPNIRPGQKLTLPAGRRAVAARQAGDRPSASAAQPARTVAPSAASPTAAPSAAAPPSDWTGAHTVAQGESLYAIARRYRVRSAELQSANGIADPTKVRPGTVLKVPAGSGAGAPAAVAAPAAAPPAAPAIVGSAPVTARVVNAAPAPQRVAALPSESQTDAPPAANPATPAGTRVAAADTANPAAADAPKLAGTGKFRWPVKGKVIAGFGPRPDGTHNDGINISVPQGTDVAAAEAGVVAYAGNELKGYGNLILVRHENNWVTAYAHNESLLVKRGDKVRRGQIVAKAGATGTVDQPQVHFELRQGSKPVDPMPHMEKQ